MATRLQTLPPDDAHICMYELYPEPATYKITGNGPAILFACSTHVDDALAEAETDESEYYGTVEKEFHGTTN